MRESYKLLPILPSMTPPEVIRSHRLNCLGSLYYFIKFALRRKKLTPTLHLPFCRSLESSRLSKVVEYPRDHYKTTICSEGAPMWWALPLIQQDIDELYQLGYSNEFLQFMRRVHNPATRTLLISENDTNAKKIGFRVDQHFLSNAVYRTLFPETIPTSQEVWTAGSMHVHIPGGSPNGEGTFDYIGVGGALQSRHYDRSVEDDLVGRKAIESVSVMDKTIDYHKLLPGAFESDSAKLDNDRLVAGNRWGFSDMNSYIREEEPWWEFESHSALGGCCALHPAGNRCFVDIGGRKIELPSDRPIFPEMFSLEKLAKRKKQMGPYYFSCQFLNTPSAPEDADFKSENLRFYSTYINSNNYPTIRHDVYDGVVMKDLPVSFLSLTMVVDPNHSGNAGGGRSRHAICVLGISDDMDFYFLDYWAKHGSYDSFFDNVYKMAENWRIREVGFETIAAQKYAAYHIETRNNREKWPIKIKELRGEVDTPDGGTSRKKEWRIRNVLGPIFDRRNFWVKESMQEFIAEYKTFPKGQYMDILDALAYAPQILRHHVPYEQHVAMLARNRAGARELNKRYVVA